MSEHAANELATAEQRHLNRAHAALDDALRDIRAARVEIQRLEDHVDVLYATNEVVHELLADWHEVRERALVHIAATRHVDGGMYGPNGTPEMHRDWSEICRQEQHIEFKLRAIARRLSDERAKVPALRSAS